MSPSRFHWIIGVPQVLQLLERGLVDEVGVLGRGIGGARMGLAPAGFLCLLGCFVLFCEIVFHVVDDLELTV